MGRINTVLEEVRKLSEVGKVTWGDIHKPLLKMGVFSQSDIDRVSAAIFGPNYKVFVRDYDDGDTYGFLKGVEKVFGVSSKQFTQTSNHFRSQGWQWQLGSQR